MAKKSTTKRIDQEFGDDLVSIPEAVAPDGTKLMSSSGSSTPKLRVDATTGGASTANDVTKAKQAKNKEAVDSQDARTRIWQSLNTTYGQRTEESNRAYDLNRNAADRAALQRGMGRSSYNLATMANIDTEKAKAADRIQQELIADYQSRIGALEQQEQAQKNWQAEFDFNKENQQKQIAIQYINNLLQNGGTPSDDLLKQAGLSRKDYDQMKKKQSGGGRYPKKPTTTGDDDKNGDNGGADTDDDVVGDLDTWFADNAKENEPGHSPYENMYEPYTPAKKNNELNKKLGIGHYVK